MVVITGKLTLEILTVERIWSRKVERLRPEIWGMIVVSAGSTQRLQLSSEKT